MNEDEAPVFLERAQVDAAHNLSLATFGGLAGVRDEGGLESAIGAPQNVFYYESGDLFEVAAAYAFHIAEAQAYLDGNKRTAIACALAFFRRNGEPAKPKDPMDLYSDMIAVAAGELDRPGLAAKMRELFAGQ